MAEVKISDLTAAVSVAGADLIPVVQGGVTKKATASLAPVSTAQQTALDLKANLAGPTFTGTVTVPSGAVLATPASMVGTNITGTASGLTAGTASAVAVGGITGLGTGVPAALAIAVGSAGGPVTFNGAGGTPSSMTATNVTGLPVAGITASTSTALGVGSIELGHASANTLTASGGVLSIEGVAIPTATSTTTFTNKRITKRTGTTTSTATPSIDSDTIDTYSITALAVAITSLSITGTPTEGQTLILWIKDDGTARAVAFGTTTQVASTDLAFPTTTTLGKYLYCTFIYNTIITKWVMTGKIDNI